MCKGCKAGPCPSPKPLPPKPPPIPPAPAPPASQQTCNATTTAGKEYTCQLDFPVCCNAQAGHGGSSYCCSGDDPVCCDLKGTQWCCAADEVCSATTPSQCDTCAKFATPAARGHVFQRQRQRLQPAPTGRRGVATSAGEVNTTPPAAGEPGVVLRGTSGGRGAAAGLHGQPTGREDAAARAGRWQTRGAKGKGPGAVGFLSAVHRLEAGLGDPVSCKSDYSCPLEYPTCCDIQLRGDGGTYCCESEHPVCCGTKALGYWCCGGAHVCGKKNGECNVCKAGPPSPSPPPSPGPNPPPSPGPNPPYAS